MIKQLLDKVSMLTEQVAQLKQDKAVANAESKPTSS
jgi:hypothetical protein